ncbi:hypothetical protein [Rhizobium viscosum]|uniref:Uncharacterized protein n=1 Tax=Rhizobium viscosum TaxID=1673 RepID=A0ABR9IXI4_RHIVS|nr:hypothetical protein [Rhizobium viscosum]MBE1507861.1 hypothetical protein [Rhizobium viscosum]
MDDNIPHPKGLLDLSKHDRQSQRASMAVFARLGRALVKSVIAGIATVLVDGNSVHLHQDDIFHGGQMWKQIEAKVKN